MGTNCICCSETPKDSRGVKMKILDDTTFDKSNKIWIRQMTKQIVKEILQ